MWVFLVLFVISLFAEFIANDKPIYIHFDGKNYFPVFVTYPDTDFGDVFGTAADYLDPHLQKYLAERHALRIWPPIPFSYSTIVSRSAVAVSVQADLAADQEGLRIRRQERLRQMRHAANTTGSAPTISGRDVLARLIYGFRISVLFGLILTIVSSIIGVAAGAVQGYFGGWTDLLFQRFIEIWTSVPELYLLLIISSVLVPGFFVLLGILLLFSWMRLVGLVRAEFLRGRNFEYIQAARALGVSNAVIMFRHLLPNAMVATLTFLPFIMSSSVMTLTALDFLGFGLPPGSPSLGELLSQGKANVQAPWLGLTGFFAVAHHAVAADLHRRSGARRLRSAEDVCMSAEPLLSVRDLSVAFRHGGRETLAVDRVSFDIGKGETWRWSANPAPANR